MKQARSAGEITPREIPLTTLGPVKSTQNERGTKKTSVLTSNPAKEPARIYNPGYATKGRLLLKKPLSLIRETSDEPAAHFGKLAQYGSLVVQSNATVTLSRNPQPAPGQIGSHFKMNYEGPNVISGIDPDTELPPAPFHSSRIERV